MMPMPTDQQADARDQAATEPGVANESIDLLGPILLGPKGKVLDAFMGAHQHIADLLQRQRQQIHAGDFQFETGQARDRRSPPPAPPVAEKLEL